MCRMQRFRYLYAGSVASLTYLFTVLAQILNVRKIFFQCFALGAEIGSHKNDHSYQFMVNIFQYYLSRCKI